jgi:hypothetical protein
VDSSGRLLNLLLFVKKKIQPDPAPQTSVIDAQRLTIEKKLPPTAAPLAHSPIQASGIGPSFAKNRRFGRLFSVEARCPK